MEIHKAQKSILVAVLTAATSFYAISPAEAIGFNQFVGLGDSTLDSGYFRYHSMGTPAADAMLASAIAAGANGGFAGNGVMVTTILAGKFGLNALPIDGGGTNYANGGSLTAPDTAGNPGNVPLTTQISHYLASVNGVANPNALYVISSGNNDLANIADQNRLDQQSSALAASVLLLQNAGAHFLLVPNSFRYANLASLGGEITDPTNAAEYARLIAYNAGQILHLSAFISFRWILIVSSSMSQGIPQALGSLFCPFWQRVHLPLYRLFFQFLLKNNRKHTFLLIRSILPLPAKRLKQTTCTAF